ncbi:putative bifunctional polynucleotide phosphatase/kinase [Cotonvirus japonicus]|uniref:Bifunctional polynucleotide phosphatase/kinase n=1 Tax=Cotonvirus japonicus TaxID=2811091 RepID=A0ABM7NSE5_9VIRU|nr:putative bifunctional polynucleotide phosphatase/kinase [Cotonvirus japonicus]BCS83069.1 putative bifunctional polynucleotide phosphatase/kinase [Cotonvirus japonicus]
MEWIETNSYIKGIHNNLKLLHDPVRIAAFDLDDTLIYKSKADKKWKLLDGTIKDKIANLINNNYIIIIFTNQGGMSINKNFDKLTWRKAADDLMKIMLSVSKSEYYFAIYAAKKYDIYRKPNLGMWKLMKQDLIKEFNLNQIRISKKSFYCGDAAGRTQPSPLKKKIYPKSKKGDFSDTDRKFALNIGINFMTPEQFYLVTGSKDIQPYILSGLDPVKYIENISNKLNEPNKYIFKPRKKEMIIMIGQPGSGKSYFARNYIEPQGYAYINQDVCKTKSKCKTLTLNALEQGKSIVIDNTNPDILSRMEYTTLAKENGYKHIRAIVMNTSDELAKHLNNVRHVYSNGKIPKITDIVYCIHRKKYIGPQESEDFDKIEYVDFVFDEQNLLDEKWKHAFYKLSEYK